MSDIRGKFEELQIETTAIVWDGKEYKSTGGKYADGVALAANFGFHGFKQGYESRQEEIDKLKEENRRLKEKDRGIQIGSNNTQVNTF